MTSLLKTSEPIISLRDVGVEFSRNRRRHRSIKDLLLQGRTGRPVRGEFWPIRHVSFDIHAGEAVGVVGRNGAGKSTLLSLIAGVLLPDEGTVTVNAGVAPLIAITGGFSGDLTGRDNITLVAQLHGMTKRELDQAFDEIVDFAELSDFLDTPFKHYSSGMKVRLAFSVVSRLREPILLVDEVLAVGDRAFREKCLKRIDDLLSTGQTLFFVSHSEQALKRFCERGLYLAGGRLKADGPIGEVLDQFIADTGGRSRGGEDDGAMELDFATSGAGDDDGGFG